MSDQPVALGQLRFTDVAEARGADGVRLVLLTSVPSPWSDAAAAIFAVKGIDALGVRFRPGDAEVMQWTGVVNAPVVFSGDDPPRSGWAEILALAERLDQRVPLVPADTAARVRVLGFAHEICGEGGLAWSRRILFIHDSIASQGQFGFPLPLAHMLAVRYGYEPERVPAARQRVIEVLRELDAELARSQAEGSSYITGGRLTALDLYTAAVVNNLAPLPNDLRPIVPVLRPAFERLDDDIGLALTPALRAHRDFICRAHLGLALGA